MYDNLNELNSLSQGYTQDKKISIEDETSITGASALSRKLRSVFGKINQKMEAMCLSAEYLLIAFINAFLFAQIDALLKLKEHDPFSRIFIENLSIPRFIFVFVASFCICGILQLAFNKKTIIPRIFLALTVIYSVMLVWKRRENVWFCAGLAFILCCVIWYCVKNDKIGVTSWKISYKQTWIFASLAFVIFSVFVSYFTILHHRNYSTSTFDTGIFAQTFEYMRTTGLPDNTSERNLLMSHFAVHFSPVFYLLLPFYCIYPTVETLMVLQAVGIAAAVFPINAICKELKISPKTSIIICFMYIFLPTLQAGAFFEWHENKFLTVFLLWTIYFLLKNKTLPMCIFMLCTLSVKEDTFVYPLCLGLFAIFAQKKFKNGIILVVSSVAYFFIVMKIMGALAPENVGNLNFIHDRFGDLMLPDKFGDDHGFFDIILTCILNFSYLLSICFTQEKIFLMIWLFLPVLFAPLYTNKRGELFLLLPIFVMHLIISWPYCYDKDYQYTYGTAALVLVAALLVFSRLDKTKIRMFALSGMCIALILTVANNAGKWEFNYKRYKDDRLAFAQTDFILDSIPKNASITSTTYFTPHLADHKIIYLPDINAEIFDTKFATDYFVFNYTSPEENSFAERYLNMGYTSVARGEKVEVLKSP